MNLSRGPQIVSHQDDQEAVGKQRRSRSFSVDKVDWPAAMAAINNATVATRIRRLCAEGLERARKANRMSVAKISMSVRGMM
ncbi:MAG: hypothetical protein DMG45_25120 [Acidobacteria bacterium]|nr:MAG: hypothetical protein DMG45_25120 [Acidobacteriota bacterium]